MEKDTEKTKKKISWFAVASFVCAVCGIWVFQLVLELLAFFLCMVGFIQCIDDDRYYGLLFVAFGFFISYHYVVGVYHIFTFTFV